MMKKIYILMILVMLLSITSTVFAGEPQTFDISVRNHTGSSVQLNYKDADGSTYFAEIPTGVSTLTLKEGRYDYWVDPQCGHIAGTMNVNQQRQIIWIDCDDGVGVFGLVRLEKKGGGVSLFGCSGGRPDTSDLGYYLSLADFGPTFLFVSETQWQDPDYTMTEFLAAYPNRVVEYGCMNWDIVSIRMTQDPTGIIW